MQTLLLDVGYQPLQRVPWETAIVWVLDRVVEVVDQYDRDIHTVNWKVPMPSVVRLLKPIHRRKAIKFSRHGIYARDKGRCQYCSRKVSKDRFTYDHVVPRSQGGQTSWQNVVCSCVDCNQRKAGRTPQQAGMQLRTEPVRPRSLPDISVGLTYQTGMPKAWETYLRSAVYWEGELAQE